ncbi:hypothetical protein [Methanocrinis sp.]
MTRTKRRVHEILEVAAVCPHCGRRIDEPATAEAEGPGVSARK